MKNEKVTYCFNEKQLNDLFIFSAGGFYQDEFAFTGILSYGMGCKLCPLGHYVPPHSAPGRAITECILCPQGWCKAV